MSYVERRNALRTTFPAAYDFLIALPRLRGAELGKKQNLHFYWGENFLFRLELPDAKTQSPHIVFRRDPDYHQTKPGKKNASSLLFPDVLNDIIKTVGNEKEWRQGWHFNT